MTAGAGVLLSWDELVATALVGTERRPLPPAPPEAEGADAIALATAGALRDGGLLAAAAVLVAVRQAGAAPPPAPPGDAPEPAPADGRPLPSGKRTDALATILTDPQYRRALPEWLQLAEGAGRRAPPELVPVLLDTVRGAGAPARAAAVRVAGPLAQWLAARNPAWSWVARVPSAANTRADSGDPAAVAEAEAALRRHGLDPASIGLLEQLPGPWSAAFSERLLDTLAAHVAPPGRSGATAVRAALQMLAISLHPAVADAAAVRLAGALGEPPGRAGTDAPAAQAVEKAQAYWRLALAKFLSLLSFCKAMHEEMR